MSCLNVNLVIGFGPSLGLALWPRAKPIKNDVVWRSREEARQTDRGANPQADNQQQGEGGDEESAEGVWRQVDEGNGDNGRHLHEREGSGIKVDDPRWSRKTRLKG